MLFLACGLSLSAISLVVLGGMLRLAQKNRREGGSHRAVEDSRFASRSKLVIGGWLVVLIVGIIVLVGYIR
jgi:hypothetical protein